MTRRDVSTVRRGQLLLAAVTNAHSHLRAEEADEFTPEGCCSTVRKNDWCFVTCHLIGGAREPHGHYTAAWRVPGSRGALVPGGKE